MDFAENFLASCISYLSASDTAAWVAKNFEDFNVIMEAQGYIKNGR